MSTLRMHWGVVDCEGDLHICEDEESAAHIVQTDQDFVAVTRVVSGEALAAVLDTFGAEYLRAEDLAAVLRGEGWQTVRTYAMGRPS